MMLTASAIPTMGLSEYWLTIITGAQYYSTPENEWALHILPHLPDWDRAAGSRVNQVVLRRSTAHRRGALGRLGAARCAIGPC